MKSSSPSAAKLPPEDRDRLILIGAALRRARVRRALTREGLAGKLLMGRNTLQRIEAGDPAVSVGYYAAVADFLGVPLLATPPPDAILPQPGENQFRARGKPISADWF